jgi:23S rRNA A2030 N6-methylase RlmJ
MATPMSSTSSSDSLKENLLNFMARENRPFAFYDIHSRLGKHLHRDLQKQELQTGLEMLVAKKQILEKTYGKLKVYCINNKLSQINNETVSSPCASFPIVPDV